jgi:hypothetical protein
VQKSFSFFTVLTYWGIAFYFFISALHTFSHARQGNPPLLNRFPRPLQALHSLFFTTVTTLPFLVTIVYWAVLFSGLAQTPFTWWTTISEHGLNSAFALFEIIFTRVNPQPWIHLIWLILLLSLYLGLAYILYAVKHYYVYSFLKPNPSLGAVGIGIVAGYVIGIGVSLVGIFLLSKGAIALRKWAVEQKLGMFGVRREIGTSEL